MLLIHIERSPCDVDTFTGFTGQVEVSDVAGAAHVQICVGAPPLGDPNRRTDVSADHLPGSQVLLGNESRIGIQGIGDLGKEVSRTAIGQAGGVAIHKGMRQLNTVRVLRQKEWVATLEGQLVQLIDERIQILIRRTINSAAEVKLEIMILIWRIGEFTKTVY